MNNLMIVILGFLKMGGMFIVGVMQLMLICAIITKLTKNKYWLRNDINRLRNYLNKGIYN